MVTRRDVGHGRAPGEIARRTAANRGILTGDLLPLGDGAVVRQQPMHCGLDWRPEPVNGIRWSARSPRPRMLLPVTGGRADLDMQVFHRDRNALGSLALWCNGAETGARIGPATRTGPDWTAQVQATVSLRPDAPSVLSFRLDGAQAPAEGRRGIGIGDLRLRPA
jgi:hypothetical protein